MKKHSASLCLLLALFAGSGAQAEAPPHLKAAHVGLPGSDNSYRSRNGAWTPVYVTLKASPEGNGPDAFRLAVETTDGEDVPYRYTTAVPALEANAERTVITYVRPGSDGSTFTLQLQTSAGADVLALPARDASQQEIVGPRALFTLILGSDLPGLTAATAAPPAARGSDPVERVYSFTKSVDALPEQWFGYDGVDVVVLTTSDAAFVGRLLKEAAGARRAALREWVQRGGRLILSAGHNTKLASQLLRSLSLFACTIPDKGAVERPSLAAVREWAGREVRQSPGRVELAELVPGAGASVLLRERPGETSGSSLPLLVEGSCGRGRVVVTAFDLDLPPVSTWEGQTVFSNRLLSEVGPRLVRAAPGSEGDRELAGELKRSLETFAEVPVISFGWVAIFILFYIIIIGPLDYLLLKKVFQRLELTWLTFPAVVVTLSVAAYFTASYLKGDERRINKVDVVDIDLHGTRPEVYGSTWFTFFSPSMHSYAINLAVNEKSGWAGANPAGNGMMVTPMDGPEGAGKRSAHSLFHRPYQYAASARALEHVPVPIWATRTFQASWHGSAPAAKPPIEAKLTLSRDGKAVVGRIINHLPVELRGLTLFYRGKWYPLPNLVPGDSYRVERLFDPHRPRDVSQWFQDWNPEPGKMLPLETQVQALLKPLFFHARAEGTSSGNSSLRFLDEAWRLRPQGSGYRDEVILVARTTPRTGPAEEVTASAASPSQLWLDAAPGAEQRPPLSGSLNQVTYIRAFIPVAGAAPARDVKP